MQCQCTDASTSGNDLLCKVHNPVKRLFGHEKKSAIGRLQKQIPIFLKYLPNQNRILMNFGVLEFYERSLWHCNSMFGRTYSAKGSAQKIPKFIKILFKLQSALDKSLSD